MKTSVAVASTAVLFGITAVLAYVHDEYALFPWYEWLKTQDAAVVIWGITIRLVGGVQAICFGSLFQQVRNMRHPEGMSSLNLCIFAQIVPLAGERGMQPLGQQLRNIAQVCWLSMCCCDVRLMLSRMPLRRCELPRLLHLVAPSSEI